MDSNLIWAIAKEPRTRIAAATIAGSAPLVWGGLVWVSHLPFVQQLIVGLLMGIATMASFHFCGVHRTQQRRHKAVVVHQLTNMDANALKRIFPASATPSWIQNITDLEKVEWINRGLDEVWPYLDQAASQMLDAQLQPILDEYKFGPIQKIDIESITLGSVAPLIAGIRFTPVGENEAMLEMEVDWRHGRDHKIVLDIVSTGPDFRVQVVELKFHGVLRVIMKPLTDQLPCFGAAVASLREPPTIDFAVKFLGGDVLQLPGVEGMIDEIIRNAVSDMLVWPNRMIFPILPGDYSFLELRPVAYLEVHVIEAKNLLNKEWIGKSDPFVYVYVRQKKELMQRTETKSNTTHPKWNQHFIVDVEDPESQKLHFRVMDSDKVDAADFLGLAEVPISELEPNVPKEMWLKLLKDPKVSASDKDRGELHVIVTFRPFKRPEKDEGPKELLPSVPEDAGIGKETDKDGAQVNKDVSTPTALETRQESVETVSSDAEHHDDEKLSDTSSAPVKNEQVAANDGQQVASSPPPQQVAI